LDGLAFFGSFFCNAKKNKQNDKVKRNFCSTTMPRLNIDANSNVNIKNWFYPLNFILQFQIIRKPFLIFRLKNNFIKSKFFVGINGIIAEL